MCNNNCCTCCNCSIHDEDTPQEITYTSVCDSDACKNRGCCCKCDCNKPCEDDASLLVYGLSEKMEECCEQVHETLEQINCEIEDIKEHDAEQDAKNDEQDDKIEDLYNRESIDVNSVVYVDTKGQEVIEFWHIFPQEDEKEPVKLGEVDAKPFLKDGILDSVELESDGHTLHFVWNTDAGKQDSHVDLDRLVQPIAQELNLFKTTVANTYETKVAAGNHINNVEYDANDHHTLIFTKENGQTITRTIPDSDKYIQSGQYTGGNLVLTKNDSTTVTIPVPATNHIVGGSITDRTITLTRENNGTPVTIQLPADNDHNYYVDGGSISGNTLTLTRTGGLSDVTIQLPNWSTTDANTYPVSGTVANNTLTLTMNDNTTVPISLPAWITSYTDTNYYPTEGSVDSSNVLILSSQTNDFPTMTVQLPNYSRTDNDHYVTSGEVVNNTLKLTRQGITGTVDVALPTYTDNDHYVTSGEVVNNTLKLTRDGVNGTVDIQLPTDNTNPIVDVSQSGTTVTFTYKDNTTENVTVGGGGTADGDHYPDTFTVDSNRVLHLTGTNSTFTELTCQLPADANDDHYPTSGTYDNNAKTITISGNTGFSPFTIDLSALVNRIAALEGLWKKTANNDGLEPVTATHKVYGYGFYDTTVS